MSKAYSSIRDWGGIKSLLAWAGLGIAFCAMPAAAQDQSAGEIAEEASEALRNPDPARGTLSVGAGSMAYIAQESPATAFALNARYDYSVVRNFDLEGAVLTAVSQSADDDQAVIPLFLEGGGRLKTRQYGPLSLFGGAGLGYGAYLGSADLQDGLTLTMPLSAGVEWERPNLTLAPRFTYRPVFGDQLGDEEVSGDSWTAVLDVSLPFI